MDMPMRSRDGIAGSCHDLLFDDRLHTVRFVIVDVGRWLPGRKVLVSPFAVSPQADDIACDLSVEQVRTSPDIDCAPPVSRAARTGSDDADVADTADAGPVVSGESIVNEARRALAEVRARSNLRSAREVLGYDVASRDGHEGRVTDLLFDPDAWRMASMVIGRGWPIQMSKRVLPFDAIDRISMRRARILVRPAPAA